MITLLQLARAMGAEETEDGAINGSEFERLGLPMLGGCQVCQATIAAYNACPTTTGYLSCTNCVETEGYATVEVAAEACGLVLPAKTLDSDQQHNADALEALGVEYPIQRRFLITESQLAAVAEALGSASSIYEVFATDEEDTAERIRSTDKALEIVENLDPAGGCEHWNRTCRVCGVWPVLEGWLAGEEYYCNPCGEACTTEEYTDEAGVEHTGLSVPEACRLTWKDYPDCDFFYWTQWELCDGDCTDNTNYISELDPDYQPGNPQREPCTCHCWLCTKYATANANGS